MVSAGLYSVAVPYWNRTITRDVGFRDAGYPRQHEDVTISWVIGNISTPPLGVPIDDTMPVGSFRFDTVRAIEI